MGMEIMGYGVRSTEPTTERGLYESRLSSTPAVETGRMFLLASETIEVRVKLENPLWERVLDVNPNLLRASYSSIISK